MNVALEQIIATCLMTPKGDPFDPACVWGLPLNITGLSAGGKSERIAQACKAVSLPMFTVYPSAKQPEDFGGAPYITPEGIEVGCILPAANRLLNLGEGVLFIDELTTASPRVQSAALGVVQDRRVGDQPLPPKTRIITAMNPPEYTAGGYPLDAPMSSRLMHIDYVLPTVDEWEDWCLDSVRYRMPDIHQAEDLVRQRWNDFWGDSTAKVIGFLKAAQEHMHKQPKPEDLACAGPWPSHRMWNWVRRGICTARCLGMPEEMTNIIVEGCVGPGVMVEWSEWMSKADLPLPQEALDKGWRPDTQRLDITMMVTNSIVVWLSGMDQGPVKEHYAALTWNLISAASDIGQPDIAVKSANRLVNMGLMHDHPNPLVASAAREAILKLGRAGVSSFGSIL